MAAGNSGKLWRWGVPLAVFFLIWFWPTPESLVASAGAVNAVKAWHMLAIFAATIVGILTSPVPSGVLMILALAVCYLPDLIKPTPKIRADQIIHTAPEEKPDNVCPRVSVWVK